MIKKIVWVNIIVFVISINFILAQEEANCGIHGWVIDKDPKGLNVRNQPNLNGKIIGNLPHKSNEDDDIIMVYITGYSNGWLKIAQAEPITGEKVFDDIGWISAKMVETGTQSNNNSPIPIYLAAKASSKKVGNIPGDVTVKIAGYQCGWVKIIYKGKTGWVQEKFICGNPVTTCV